MICKHFVGNIFKQARAHFFFSYTVKLFAHSEMFSGIAM